jgi:hypothetical protein
VKLVFADIFYWIALINPRDSANQRALSFSRSLDSSIVTTDEVQSIPFL